MYHVNPTTGEPGPCRASEGRCPFGGPAVHYATMDRARAAYELSQAGEAVPPAATRNAGEARAYKSSAVRDTPTGPIPTVAQEQAVNRWPSCYSDAADSALRHATGDLYEWVATARPTRDEFFERAESVFDNLERTWGDDGIGDSEPRLYWKDHLDAMADSQGWRPFYS